MQLLFLIRQNRMKLVVARLGSPIAIGIGKDKKEYFVASDASPFIEYTKDAIYLEDEEMAIIKCRKRTCKDSKNQGRFFS